MSEAKLVKACAEVMCLSRMDHDESVEAALKAALDVLGDVDDHLASLVGGTDWNAANIEARLRAAIVEGMEKKARVAFGPIRVAISGARVSPPPFEPMEILGKTSTPTLLFTQY